MTSFHYLILSSYSPALYSAASLLVAVILDHMLGEPNRWHPLVGFGWLANQIEQQWNRQNNPFIGRLLGLCGWLALLLPFAFLSYWARLSPIGWLVDTALLYFSIGAHSLMQHAERICTPLSEDNLVKAREALSMIVSRDCAELNASEIATASVESVLENGNDAIFGAIFWFVLFGGTGALIFRLANTLDAMWGYRTSRFLYFGWAAARLDDLLNFIPARLTALSYALCGHTGSGLKCWLTQAKTWYSPNAGPVMSAGAGAIQVKLGGTAKYQGKAKNRPLLGMGSSANCSHILAAMRLVKRSMIMWCVTIVLSQILWRIYIA